MEGQLSPWDGTATVPEMLRAKREALGLAEDPRSNITLLAFTDPELLSLRKLLLPGRMEHHDSSGEAKLRKAANNARERSKLYRRPHD